MVPPPSGLGDAPDSVPRRRRLRRLDVDEQGRRLAAQERLGIEHQILLEGKELESQKELFAERLTPRRELEKARDEHAFWLARKDLFLASEERDEQFREAQVRQAEEAVARRRRSWA